MLGTMLNVTIGIVESRRKNLEAREDFVLKPAALSVQSATQIRVKSLKYLC